MRQRTERILPFSRYEVTNGDFYLIMKRIASKKESQVTKAVTSPKVEKIINKIVWVVVLSLTALLGIHILIALVK